MHNIKLLVKIITANYDRMRNYLTERMFLVGRYLTGKPVTKHFEFLKNLLPTSVLIGQNPLFVIEPLNEAGSG